MTPRERWSVTVTWLSWCRRLAILITVRQLLLVWTTGKTQLRPKLAASQSSSRIPVALETLWKALVVRRSLPSALGPPCFSTTAIAGLQLTVQIPSSVRMA
ncbi:hypothetical protein HRbin27_01458 [bacterium HR27]|nr:hypothetical protein HRbin27_01458 [bacterium HR27]